MIDNLLKVTFRPSIARRLLAHIFVITTTVCASTGAIWAGWALRSAVTSEFAELCAYIFCIICSAALGWIVAAFFIWKWIAQFLFWIVGSDFKIDDIVYILKGPHKGKSAPIYEVWDQRYQVRVFIGEHEKKAVTDVFSYHEIINRSR